MIDFTRSTHATDAQGNKVPLRSVEQAIDGAYRAVFDGPHYDHVGVKWNAGEYWSFNSEGTSYCGLTLLPPEDEGEAPEEVPSAVLTKSLRDEFAGQAMAAIISKSPFVAKPDDWSFYEKTAIGAYDYADAMLKAREQTS